MFCSATFSHGGVKSRCFTSNLKEILDSIHIGQIKAMCLGKDKPPIATLQNNLDDHESNLLIFVTSILIYNQAVKITVRVTFSREINPRPLLESAN
ncbi:hypothetical protein PR048_009875 [Dryococelus australis]|uniref:Uncharacterized protein n=1 Tax=Dryococelus australis TaxID=614101 RepID=A0ABQ9I170_9NEOP|nr:hypothetical protein PR048_009875 [Dryococelus australis]